MMFSRILLLGVITLLLVNCNNTKIPEEYFKEPVYITNPTAQNKAYYNAYNETLSLWDVGFEDIYIPTTYGTAHVLVSGPESGTPLVLLHGMDASSTSWYPNIKSLSKNNRVYAIDLLIEPGKSQMTNKPESVDHLVLWYHEIFKKLHLKKIHLVGASRGGWIAVKIALLKAIEIKKMVLLSPAQTFMWIPPSQDLMKNIIYALSSDEKRMHQVLKTMSKNVSVIDDRYLKQYYLGTQLDSNNMFVSSMMPYSKKELEVLDIPVLVLIGDDDMINNSRSLEIAKESIKNIEGKIISGAGHFLSIDQAKEVNQIINSFLTKKK